MTTKSNPASLFDTNVLIYAADATAPQHKAALALRDKVEMGSLMAAITPQILLEFVSLITTKRVTAPRSIEQAWKEVGALSTVFHLLQPPVDLISQMHKLVPTVKPRGPEVYDLAIAVTALSAAIATIYTYDTTVFARVKGLNVIVP